MYRVERADVIRSETAGWGQKADRKGGIASVEGRHRVSGGRKRLKQCEGNRSGKVRVRGVKKIQAERVSSR